MNEQSFLSTVKKLGGYASQGEASRAAHAVFGTIKVWLTPSASDRLRQALSGDASQLWQYAPVAPSTMPQASEASARRSYFIMKVQQLGDYCSSGEASHAARSVFGALTLSLRREDLPQEAGRLAGEVVGACRSGSWRAA